MILDLPIDLWVSDLAQGTHPIGGVLVRMFLLGIAVVVGHRDTTSVSSTAPMTPRMMQFRRREAFVMD